MYNRFNRIRRWAAGGAKRERPFHYQPDIEHYSRTGTTWNYDRQLGVPASMLADWATRMASSTWDTPFSKRDMRPDMGGQGGNNDLGWTTKAQSSWLISGDRRALKYMEDQTEAAFGVPYYHKNPKYNNRWVNPVDQPWARLAWYDSNYKESSARNWSGNTGGWGIDTGHWGDMFTIPYLATARRSMCDGLLGMAAFAVMEKNPGQERLIPTATEADSDAGRTARLAAILNDGKGLDMRPYVQIRTTGWSERTIAGAIALCPASETPFGDLYMRAKTGMFKRMINDEIPFAQVNQKDAYGHPMFNAWVDSENGLASPWQAIFVIGAYIRFARLEVPGAGTYVDWAKNYYLGGFSVANFDNASMTKYRLRMASSGAYHDHKSTRWNSWAGIQAGLGSGTYGKNYEAPNAASQISGIGDYERRYFGLITQYWQFLKDHGKNMALADAAYNFTLNAPRGTTYTRANDYYVEAQNSLVRRGQTRVGLT